MESATLTDPDDPLSVARYRIERTRNTYTAIEEYDAATRTRGGAGPSLALWHLAITQGQEGEECNNARPDPAPPTNHRVTVVPDWVGVGRIPRCEN